MVGRSRFFCVCRKERNERREEKGRKKSFFLRFIRPRPWIEVVVQYSCLAERDLCVFENLSVRYLVVVERIKLLFPPSGRYFVVDCATFFAVKMYFWRPSLKSDAWKSGEERVKTIAKKRPDKSRWFSIIFSLPSAVCFYIFFSRSCHSPPFSCRATLRRTGDHLPATLVVGLVVFFWWMTLVGESGREKVTWL